MSDDEVHDAGGEASEEEGVQEPPPEDFEAEAPAPVERRTGPLRLVAALLLGLIFVGPIVIVPLVLMSRGGDRAAAWTTVTSPGAERWQVDLPAAPTISTTAVQDPAFVVTEARLATTHGGFMVKSGTLPETFLPGASTEQLLDAWDAMLAEGASAEARQVVSRGAAVVDGLPARTADLVLTPAPGQRAESRLWLVALGRRVYAFGVVRTAGDLGSPEVRRFRDSIRLGRS